LNQTELQLLTPDLQIKQLLRLYEEHRKEIGRPLTELEKSGGGGGGESVGGGPVSSVSDEVSAEGRNKKWIKQFKYNNNPSQHALECFSTNVKSLYPGWEKEISGRFVKDGPKGQPFIVVVTPNALRAVEFVRETKKLQMKTKVVKLFARHLKVSSLKIITSKVGSNRKQNQKQDEDAVSYAELYAESYVCDELIGIDFEYRAVFFPCSQCFSGSGQVNGARAKLSSFLFSADFET